MGGSDNGVWTNGSCAEVVGAFLCGLRSRWPCLRADLSDDVANTSENQVPIDKVSERLPARGVLFLVRDEEMGIFRDDHGGIPMADGEGPLDLWFWQDRNGGTEFDLVTPASRTKDDFSRWAFQLLVDACTSAGAVRVDPPYYP